MTRKNEVPQQQENESPQQPAMVTLDTFVTSIPHRGIRAGFKAVMTPERTVARTEEEWNQLLSLFRSRPIAVPWNQWVKQGGNSNG